MENHEIYGENAENHHNRTPINQLSEGFTDMLKRFQSLNQNKPILDIGCATGRDLRYLHNQCGRESESYGLDASKQMLEFAENKTDNPNINYLTGDMTRLPVQSNNISGVWCQATIFMVEENKMRKAINEINRVMIKNGLGVISFKLSDEQSSDNGVQYRERWGSTIKYYFVDEDAAVNMLNESGFRVFDREFSEFGDTRFLNTWIKPE